MLNAAFTLAVFSRRIVGSRVATNMSTELVLDTLEQVMWSRGKPMRVANHSDRGSRYLRTRYSECLVELGFELSEGLKGDSCDNGVAESVIRFFSKLWSLTIRQLGGHLNRWSMPAGLGLLVQLRTSAQLDRKRATSRVRAHILLVVGRVRFGCLT